MKSQHRTRIVTASYCLSWFIVLSANDRGVAQTPILAGDVTRVATGFGWAEGPVYDGAGGIWFTDLASAFPNAEPKRILRYDIDAQVVSVMDPDSGGSNGLAFDATGTLITADGDMQRVTRRPVGTDFVVLADSWMEARLNGPNDIAIDSQGGIFFTDPNYFHNEQEQSVYYLDAEGNLRRLASRLSHPNGIALAPDERTLYVAEEASNRVLAFNLDDDRNVAGRSVFARGIHPDGMTIDRFGNLYISGLGAFDVTVWNPAGQRILTIPIGEWVANVGLAGDDETDLYITATSSLYHVPLQFVPAGADCNGDSVLDVTDLSCVATVEARDVVLETLNTLSGDLDGNGDVSFADFLVLSTNFGTDLPSYTDGNIDLEGGIDFADFLVLSTNFGKTSGDVTAVPEPSSLVMTCISLLSVIAYQRHRRR